MCKLTTKLQHKVLNPSPAPSPPPAVSGGGGTFLLRLLFSRSRWTRSSLTPVGEVHPVFDHPPVQSGVLVRVQTHDGHKQSKYRVEECPARHREPFFCWSVTQLDPLFALHAEDHNNGS